MTSTLSRKASYFVKVELNTVVQMELHILTRPGEKEEWMQKRHCQEIEMLLSDVIKNRVNDELKRNQTKKLRKKWAHCPQKPRSDFDTFTQPQILTGESLRMAYSFQKRSLPHSHLLMPHKDAGYRSLRIFREKLVVFVYHLAGYTSYQKGLNEVQQTAACDQLPKMSSYFKAEGRQDPDLQHHNILKNIVRHKLEMKKSHMKKNKAEISEKRILDITKEKNDFSTNQNTPLLIRYRENDEHKINYINDNHSPHYLREEEPVLPDNISADDICKLNIEEVGKSKNKTQKRKLHRIAEDDIKENTNCVRPAEVVSCVQKSSRNAVTSVRLDLGKLSDKQKPFDGEGSKNSSSSSLDVNNYIGEHHKKGSTKTLAGTKLRHKKQKKKMKLIDQYLDDFSDSSTGDKDDTAIEEASLGLKETSALLKDAVTVDKSCQRNDKEKGRDGILASNTGKITKDKFKFRRLELKRTTVPLSDESSFFKSREVPSVDRKVVPRKRQKNSSCMSPGYPETVSVSSQSFHNKVRSSGVESSSNVNMTAGYVFKHQPDTVPLNEDLQPSASSSDLHHSEIISNSMVKQDVDEIMDQDFSRHIGDDPRKPVIIGECDDDDDDGGGDNDDDQIIREIQQIGHISSLSEEHLTYMIKANEGYLRDILKCKVRNRRHDDYKSGIKQRVQLSWQIPLGLFTDSQVDMILHQLQLMFCKKNTKHLDYVLKVIFPEVLIKIYMDVFHVDHTRAESNMNDAVYQSDSQLELSLTDSTFSV